MSERYYLSDDELRKLQLIEVELLQEVDRICSKCGIRYNMVGGTMLGAIRHKGYIPWDDDADVGLLRSEYEKFREACKTELDSDRFYFQDIRDTKGYRWGYGKLRRKNTQFVRLNQEDMPYEQGVFIDVFPFDNVPDNYCLRRLHKLTCFVLRKFMWSQIGAESEKNPIKKYVYKLMRKVPEHILINWYEKLISINADKDTEQVRILTFPAPKKTFGFYKKWYMQVARYDFENITLTGAEEWNEYLTYKFGEDYMELPPEEERKAHPVSYLDLGV